MVMDEILGYEREASRLELFVRMFYSIPVCIILPLYGIIAYICVSCQWFVILIFGRRSKSLNGPIEGFIKYCVQLVGYFSYLTDERPGIGPKRLKFFRVIEEE